VGRILTWMTMALLCATLALADVYEWTDERGVVHFTDNPERVPAKYRQKVQQRESITGEAPKSSPAQPEAPAGSQEAAPKQELFGGHDLNWWRREYSSLSKAVDALSAELAKAREDVTVARRKKLILQRERDRESLAQKKEALAAKETRLSDLQKKLDDLESAAARAGVPARWRE
jgi:chromosome segregation ATPase